MHYWRPNDNGGVPQLMTPVSQKCFLAERHYLYRSTDLESRWPLLDCPRWAMPHYTRPLIVEGCHIANVTDIAVQQNRS